jgi:hypothetical protein
MATLTKEPATKDVQLPVEAPKAPRSGKIAISWDVTRDPRRKGGASVGSSPAVAMCTIQFVRGAFEQLDGRILPDFGYLHLPLPGLNWVDVKDLDDIRRIGHPEFEFLSGPAGRYAIQVFEPITETLTGTLRDYSLDQCAEMVEAIFSIEDLETAKRTLNDQKIIDQINERIRGIETGEIK